MRKFKFARTVIALMALVLLIIVNTNCKKEIILDEPVVPDNIAATDYSISSHWLSIPATVHSVDVFYLYPTAWKPDSLTNPLYSEIDDPTMLAGSASAYSRQATAFETVGNIYAPY